MKFKGTIIITDPCYIMRAKHHGTTPITKDDWVACDCGRNMEVLGINTYIVRDTIYGDWGCTTYKTNNPKKVIDDLAAITKYFNDKYEEYGVHKGITDKQYTSLCNECSDRHCALNLEIEDIGRFCSDAGLVAVFLLDEVRKYNPDIDKWITEHPWCGTTIEDFDGNVEYYVDENSEAHIYGTGNINFFTTQIDL